MPVINGVYLKDFTALPGSVEDANIIPIAISGNQIAYRTTVAGIITDARITGKLLTGLSVTGGAVVATDSILQAFGKVQNQLNNRVSSVGLTMPSAFTVAGSPVTTTGTLAVSAAGTASQYIRGDGVLADFPSGGGGGGSSVSYYLNGSVSQGTFSGNTYYEMNKVPVLGAGTDFTIATDGYIAQFITDANDPNALLIPAGNWNFETYFSASSGGGSPTFYVELYKWNGSTFTSIASSSATPELIAFGTTINPYFSTLAVPETVLNATDRLAIRIYVNHSGRTITLHTEDNHLCQVITTFTTGIQALNGLTKQTQYFAVGTSGTDFAISSVTDTHTFNLPDASATARGVITTGTQTIAGSKTFSSIITIPDEAYSVSWNGKLEPPTKNAVWDALNGSYVPFGRTLTINGTAYDLSADRTWSVGTVTSVAALTLGTTGTDLSSSVANGTTTPVITLNVPDASATARGVITTGAQTIGGAKTFVGASGSTSLTATASGSVSLAILGQASGSNSVAIKGEGGTYGILGTAGNSAYGVRGENSGSGWGGAFTSVSGPGVSGGSSSSYGGIFESNTGIGLEVTSQSGVISNFKNSGGTVVSISNAGIITQTAGTSESKLTTTASSGLEIRSDGSTASDRNIIFKLGTTVQGQIYNSGNWFIGSSPTDAGYKLDVNGTGIFRGSSATPITSINTGQREWGLFRTSLDGGFMTFQSGGANARGYIGNGGGISSAGETSFGIRSESDLILMSGGNNIRLTIASTGAATFSSDVLARSGTVSSRGYNIYEASASRGAFTTYNLVTGSGTDYSTGLFSEGEIYMASGGSVTKRLVMTTGGEVYIAGTTDQGAYNLQVNGTGVWGAGAYVNGSDLRLKNSITPLNNSLDLINKMKPVTYKFNEDYSKDQSIQTGFIAQDLQEILKDEVYLEGIVKEGGEYLSVAYQSIIPLLVKSIQEQQLQIEELKNKLI